MEFSPGNPIVGLFLVDQEVKATKQPDLKSRFFDTGYAVLRSGFDTEEETYFLFNATSIQDLGHQHKDRGSFSLYAFNTPLAVDPGVTGYSEAHLWHRRSRAHNQVIFEDAETKGPGKFSSHFFDEQIDYVEADLNKAVGEKYYRRIFFVKPDFYMIWDDIDSKKSAQYQLHVLTQENLPLVYKGQNDSILFGCQNKVDFEVKVLCPQISTNNKLF